MIYPEVGALIGCDKIFYMMEHISYIKDTNIQYKYMRWTRNQNKLNVSLIGKNLKYLPNKNNFGDILMASCIISFDWSVFSIGAHRHMPLLI